VLKFHVSFFSFNLINLRRATLERRAISLGVGRVIEYHCNMSSSSDMSKCVASSSSGMKEEALEIRDERKNVF